MIELRQLRYFVKVAELEHFGQASQDLNIVQPALSRQVKQLEQELGVELFERLARGVRLTPAGRLLLEKAQQLLIDADRLIATARLAGQGKTGFMRIAFADGATYSGHVPAIIREFRKRNPDVELELVPASSLTQAELLSQKAIDVGFVYWLPEERSNISHLALNKEQIVLAAAKSRKLSAKKKKLKLRDLKNQPFVWFKRSHAPLFYDLVVSRCNQAGLTLNIVQEAFTESTMLSLVAADIGLTFITEAARRRKPDNVTLLDVDDLDATITLKAMWRVNERNPAVIEFLNVVRQVSE